jgi:hypothetical protein
MILTHTLFQVASNEPMQWVNCSQVWILDSPMQIVHKFEHVVHHPASIILLVQFFCQNAKTFYNGKIVTQYQYSWLSEKNYKFWNLKLKYLSPHFDSDFCLVSFENFTLEFFYCLSWIFTRSMLFSSLVWLWCFGWLLTSPIQFSNCIAQRK